MGGCFSSPDVRLLEAACRGDVEKARAALDGGANCEYTDKRVRRGAVAHTACVRCARVAGCICPAEGAVCGAHARRGVVRAQTEMGQTPLSWAAEKGHTAVVLLLLERGAEMDSKTQARTPVVLRSVGGRAARSGISVASRLPVAMLPPRALVEAIGRIAAGALTSGGR
jgi:hypothetical protein